MKKHKIAKAQKRKRRNKAKHSGRMTKLDYLAGVGERRSEVSPFLGYA